MASGLAGDLTRTKSLERLNADAEGGEHKLERTLGPWSLVALGIGAVIGAGLFSLTGIAAAEHAGPAVVISFAIASIACAFAGMCYSELAGMIPVAGSAYTYAYATMGEFVAWIIGWDLVLEYAVGAATVSVSWSSYVTRFLRDTLGINLPPSLVNSPFETYTVDGVTAHGIVNLPAILIIVAVSALLMIGIRESARVNAVVVAIKLAVVAVVVGVGLFYIKAQNYVPFIPENTGTFGEYGWSGIMRGAGVVFFAYIGFDAVSTAAQEAKNPQRNMMIGILGSLAICTVIYIAFAGVLTGLVHYDAMKGDAAPVNTAIAPDTVPVAEKPRDARRHRRLLHRDPGPAARPEPGVLFHEPGPAAAGLLFQDSSDLEDALSLEPVLHGVHECSGRLPADQPARPYDQHRHPARLHPGLCGSHHPAPDSARCATGLPDAAGAAGADPRHRQLPRHDGVPRRPDLAATDCLARGRTCDLLRLEPTQ